MNTPDTVKHTGKALCWVLTRHCLFLIFLLGVFICSIALTKNAFTPDLAWLLQAGHHILEYGQLPTHDLFSWTVPDKPWVLYQWLFEVMVAAGENVLGQQLLLRVFAVVAMITYLLLPFGWVLPNRVPTVFTFTAGVLALRTASMNLSLRPLMVTTLFLAFQYILLDKLRHQQWDKRLIFTLFGLMYALWGNMHMGVSIGLISLLLMGLGDWLEHKAYYRSTPLDPEIEPPPLNWTVYLKLFAICILASLLNPYGINIYSYLVDLSSQGFLNNSIVELMSPNFHQHGFLPFLGLMGTFILLTSRAQGVFRAREILLLLVFTLATLFAQRFVVWACLYYAFILPKALYHWWHRAKQTRPLLEHSVLDFERYRMPIIASLFMIFVLFISLHQTLPALPLGACSDFQKSIDTYELSLKQPTDRLFNDATLGSCILAFYPHQKVFIDTRFDFYGSDFSKALRTSIAMQPGWNDTLQKWQINTLMLRKQWPLASFLKVHPDYATIYEDDKVIILRHQSHD